MNKQIETYRKAIQRIKKYGAQKTTYKKVTAEEQEKNVEMWTAYWRANIHRFVEEYLEIKLKLFQKIIIYLMDKFTVFIFIASRGLSKSFTVAVFSCARAILYPGEKIVIASGKKKQAKLIITEKIEKELMPLSLALRQEIEKIVNNNSECKVIFKGGSSIDVVTSNDDSRGYRATILIPDEYRLIPSNIIKTVLKPFLNVSRHPGYTDLPEYKNLKPADNKEIYLSSAWHKNSEMYKHFLENVNEMWNGDRCFVTALNYQLSIDENLIPVERIEAERKQGEAHFTMEYDTLFYGLSDNPFFAYEDINKNRKLKIPFYPIESRIILGEDFSFSKKVPKQKDEIRIMAYDVAIASGIKSDNSIMKIIRLFPRENTYLKQVVYSKNIKGMLTSKQAELIKRNFYDFECDYIALDCRGNGMGVYDQLVLPTKDDDLGKEYPAWTAFNDKDLESRASSNAVKVIYAVMATLEYNHKIATNLRNDLKMGNIQLLLNDYDANDMLSDEVDYDSLSSEKQAELLAPFIQTTLLENELINLEWELRNGYVRVYKKGNMLKDRYSCLAYGNDLARYLEEKNLKRGSSKNYNSHFFIS